MEWLHELIFQPSYLQTVLLIAVISAIGLALGQIKVKTVSLGVAFVFFIGIIIGEICDRLDIRTQTQMVQFAQNFGLILFVYSLGVQVGPGFFTSLRQGGLKLNLFGFSAIVLTTLTAIIAFLVTGLPFPDIMGLLCGAATNTPMLGAAQQSFLEVNPDQIRAANNMASACAVGYPFGVLGVLVCMIVLRFALRGREGEKKSHNETYVAEFHVSNPALFGRMIGDVEQFKVIFGEQDDKDWNRPDIDWNHIDGSNLVSRHVLVTKRHLNGVKIGSLHLRNSFDINITRVGRAGIELVASPGLRPQLGDRLTVVGTETAIAKGSEILGNEEKELRNPNLVAVFIGIFLGVVLGAIPIAVPGISVPVKLGIAGGPIIVGILMGAFGPRIHLSTYTTRSANLMVRQIGIVMYLACLGYGAGHGFIDTVFCLNGLVWILVSLFIATVPVLVCGFIQSRLGKNDYAQTAGTLCAAMANPMALSYVNSNSDEEEASEAYATVYPLAMFIRVISAQLIMLLFA